MSHGEERWRVARMAGVVLVGCLVALPVAADWLVLTNGARIETRGGWTVKGAQVVFTDSAGRLGSVAAATVDFEASRAASAASTPVRRAPAPTATRRQARLVITDADVGHVDLGAVVKGATPRRTVTAPTPTPARSQRVILYSANWCPWCTKARELLSRLGVAFVERDIDRDPGARAELAAKAGPGAGVPVVDIGGTLVRGYDPDRIEALLRRR
jgi:glutaredoxin